jgi:hypothetical protein
MKMVRPAPVAEPRERGRMRILHVWEEIEQWWRRLINASQAGYLPSLSLLGV